MLVSRLKALGVPLSGLKSRVLGLKSLINVLEVLDVIALRVWYLIVQLGGTPLTIC